MEVRIELAELEPRHAGELRRLLEELVPDAQRADLERATLMELIDAAAPRLSWIPYRRRDRARDG